MKIDKKKKIDKMLFISLLIDWGRRGTFLKVKDDQIGLNMTENKRSEKI